MMENILPIVLFTIITILYLILIFTGTFEKIEKRIKEYIEKHNKDS